MKRFGFFLLVFVFIFSSKNCFTQTKDFIIKSGFGFEQIHIGQNINNIISLIGKPTNVKTFEESKKWIESFDFSYKSLTEYRLEFDSVYYYQNRSESKVAPVFTVFTKNDTVVYIKFAAKNYKFTLPNNYKKSWTKHFRIQTDSSIRFYSKRKDNIDNIFESPVTIAAGFKQIPTYYSITSLEDGLSLVYYKNRLAGIEVFKMSK